MAVFVLELDPTHTYSLQQLRAFKVEITNDLREGARSNVAVILPAKVKLAAVVGETEIDFAAGLQSESGFAAASLGDPAADAGPE